MLVEYPKMKRVWSADAHALSCGGMGNKLFPDFNTAVRFARKAEKRGEHVISVQTVWRSEDWLREHYPELLA